MDYSKMVSGMLSGAWTSANKVAENIAGSDSFKKFYQRVAPGGSAFGKEVVESFAKRDSARIAMAHAVGSTHNLSDEVQKAFVKARSLADIEKIKESYNLSDDVTNAIKGTFSKTVEDLRKTDYTPKYKGLGPLDKARESTIAYFTNPDKATRNTRIATVAGAYGVAAVGSRYMTGGTLTRDQYGRSDIAGIPFI